MSRGGIVGRRFAVAAALIVCIGLVRWWLATRPVRGDEPDWGSGLPTGPFRDVAPRWSHDGRRIAFLREWDTGHVQLCVAPSDLSRIHCLTRPEVVNPDLPLATAVTSVGGRDELAWSRDDARIAFPRGAWFGADGGDLVPGNGLWALDVYAGTVLPVALHSSHQTERRFRYRSPSWSADGRRLAFVSSGALGRSRVGLVTLDARSSCFEREDRFDSSDWPVWSPTGGMLAFTQAVVRGPVAGRVATIRIIEPGGQTALRVLKVTPDRYCQLCPDDVARHSGITVQPYISGLRWTHDGDALVFSITPNARDLSRSSVWAVRVSDPDRPVRITADDGYGYFAPYPLAHGRLGVGRIRNGRMETVIVSRHGEVIEAKPAPCDDWEWRPDGTAVVYGGRSGSQVRTTALTIQRRSVGSWAIRLR